MSVVFDAEALLAFAFDEPGAAAVEGWLDRVYDGEIDGYVTTINLAEFRYVAARYASPEAADSYIADLRRMGVSEYGIDSLWKPVSELKAAYTVALGDAYALAAADNLGGTLLVGADDDYEVFLDHEEFGHLIERFRYTAG